ncbi:MAG: hypothetical protein L3I91_01250 [Mycoplasma sp.]
MKKWNKRKWIYKALAMFGAVATISTSTIALTSCGGNNPSPTPTPTVHPTVDLSSINNNGGIDYSDMITSGTNSKMYYIQNAIDWTNSEDNYLTGLFTNRTNDYKISLISGAYNPTTKSWNDNQEKGQDLKLEVSIIGNENNTPTDPVDLTINFNSSKDTNPGTNNWKETLKWYDTALNISGSKIKVDDFTVNSQVGTILCNSAFYTGQPTVRYGSFNLNLTNPKISSNKAEINIELIGYDVDTWNNDPNSRMALKQRNEVKWMNGLGGFSDNRQRKDYYQGAFIKYPNDEWKTKACWLLNPGEITKKGNYTIDDVYLVRVNNQIKKLPITFLIECYEI